MRRPRAKHKRCANFCPAKRFEPSDSPFSPPLTSSKTRKRATAMNDEDSAHLVKAYSSNEEIAVYQKLENYLRTCPLGPGELLPNLGLFLTRASLGRMLFMHDLFLKVIDVPGCIMEFGCYFG